MSRWSARTPSLTGGTAPALVVALLAVTGPARAAPAAQEHDRRALTLDAARADDDAFTVDGHLDEAAWTAIAPMPELIQQGPAFGA